MAIGNFSNLTIGVLATGAITQYAAVTATGVVATAAGNAVGFANTSGAIGALVPVVAGGTAIALAGAAIALGAAVEVGASGAVVTKSAGVTVGRALTAAVSIGDQVEVLVINN